MRFEDYARHPAINISTLLLMQRSPQHFHHARLHGSYDTAALSTGRLVHMAVLEPERFRKRVVVYAGRRYGKTWDEFEAAHLASKYIIASQTDYELAENIANVINKDPRAIELLRCGGQVESVIFWDHQETGLECKSRLDLFDTSRHLIVDLKTTTDASESAFGRSAARYSYHLRAAFYHDAYLAAHGAAPEVWFVAVEKRPPYAVGCYHLDEDVIEAGRAQYEPLLRRVKECRESGEWPGPTPGGSRLVLPAWAYQSEEPVVLDIGGESVHV